MLKAATAALLSLIFWLQGHIPDKKSPWELEQLEYLRSEDTPCHPMITHTIDQFILDPKSKQDKVKVTNLKNLPKLNIF